MSDRQEELEALLEDLYDLLNEMTDDEQAACGLSDATICELADPPGCNCCDGD